MTMDLIKVSQPTGLYKMEVSTVTNPPSLRPSEPFGAIYQATKDDLKVAEHYSSEKYKDIKDFASVTVTNEDAADL